MTEIFNAFLSRVDIDVIADERCAAIGPALFGAATAVVPQIPSWISFCFKSKLIRDSAAFK
jgi:hypothetical protein